MKRLTVMCAAACALLLPALAPAQDLVQTAGKNAKVVLDNADVRVIELNMPAGASTGMHEHKTDQLVVFLTGGTAKQTGADGKTKEVTRKPGEVVWSEPVKHDTKNESGKPVRTLVIELKK
ncbi:MAG TPA: cupin domain-containing protein [Lysobacter sp.]